MPAMLGHTNTSMRHATSEQANKRISDTPNCTPLTTAAGEKETTGDASLTAYMRYTNAGREAC